MSGDFMQTLHPVNTFIQPPHTLGHIKSFGFFGPKYEVDPVLRQLNDGDSMVEITLVESGEKTEYRLTHLNDDPESK
jgi:Family of unknown function (DUF5397)